MLVLSRKSGDCVVIDGNIRVTVLRVNKNRVKLAIEAPDDVRVVRHEVAFDPLPSRVADPKDASHAEVDTARLRPDPGSRPSEPLPPHGSSLS